MLLNEIQSKAASLSNGQARRLNPDKNSYWVYNFQGVKYIGFFASTDDNPGRPYFQDKPVEYKDSTKGRIEMQKL